MSLAKATDSTLLLRWRRHGDPAAFAALVDRHAAMVHSVSMRVVRNHALAQEIVQDSFLKLTQLEQFDGASLGGWLHRVTTNRAFDVAKTESRRRTRETAYEQSREAPASTSESAAVLAEIDAALSALPDDLRELVVLHYLEGATHKEIARRTGTSRATVTRNIHRALDQLREQLNARNVTATMVAIFAALESARSVAVPATLLVALRKLALQHVAKTTGMTVAISVRASAAILIAAAVIASVFGIRFLRTVNDANGDQLTQSVVTQATPASTAKEPVAPALTTPTPAPAVVQLATSSSSKQNQATTTTLRCININGDPVPGAEIYFFRHPVTNKPGLVAAIPADQPSQAFGPFQSDNDGRVSVPFIGNPDARIETRYGAHARVPGELVGAWSYSTDQSKQNGWDELVLVPSKAIEGTIHAPRGYDLTKITIFPTLLSVRTGKTERGSILFRPNDTDRYPIPSLAPQRADALGRFRFDGVPTVGAIAFAAAAPGLAEEHFKVSDEFPSNGIEITLIPESVIYGTARYKPTGAPIPNVAVLARPYGVFNSSGPLVPFVVHTDSLGRYRFAGLYEERYNVFAFPISNSLEAAAPVVRKIDAGRSRESGPVDLWFDHGGWVEGFVSDKSSGAPVDGVDICAMNPNTDTDYSNPGEIVDSTITANDGHYRIYLPSGSSTLYCGQTRAARAYPTDQAKKVVAIDTNQREPQRVDFEVTAREPAKDAGQASLRGRVVDALDKPQKGVPVYDTRPNIPGTRNLMKYFLGRTDEKGSFDFPINTGVDHNLEIGGGVMMFATTDFSLLMKRVASPHAGEVRDLGELVVERYTLSFGGRVVDETGTPVSKAEIFVEANIPRFQGATALTDNLGNFTIQYVPQGIFQLVIRRTGYKDTTIEAEPGFNYELTIEHTAENPDGRTK